MNEKIKTLHIEKDKKRVIAIPGIYKIRKSKLDFWQRLHFLIFNNYKKYGEITDIQIIEGYLVIEELEE